MMRVEVCATLPCSTVPSASKSPQHAAQQQDMQRRCPRSAMWKRRARCRRHVIPVHVCQPHTVAISDERALLLARHMVFNIEPQRVLHLHCIQTRSGTHITSHCHIPPSDDGIGPTTTTTTTRRLDNHLPMKLYQHSPISITQPTPINLIKYHHTPHPP